MDIAGHLWLRRILVFATLGAALVVLLISPAAAKAGNADLDIDDQVVLNGRLMVPEGQSVGTAVIFNGPATVDGTVRESLVVFNGRTQISGTVNGDVVVFNGAVALGSSAVVDGDVVTQSTPQVAQGATIGGSQQSIATRFDLENIGFASRYAWWIGYSVSTLVLGLLLLLLLPNLDARIRAAWQTWTGESVAWGVGLFFLVPIAAGLLLVTIVGIPLGLFLLLGLALAYTVGYVVGAQVLGRLVVRPPTSRYVAFLAGWVILRVVGLVPILGGLVWLVAAIVGLGVLAVAARRAEPPVATTTPAQSIPEAPAA
jgi:hypothetical protein